jgi:hypothetical protein
LFFRSQRYGFPLGKLPNFLHPVGTTVGYMDAIPLLAIPLRLFSAWLPQEFQYLGLWILFCSAALAFLCARIASRVTPHWEQQALVGLLIAMTPALITRVVHPALCGHMYVVAALGLNLRRIDSPRDARRSMAAALALVCAGSATHPYFAVMPLALLIGLPVRERHKLGLPLTAATLLALPAAAFGMLTLLGYIGGGMKDAIWGFGAFSSNLNTFFNSMGHSRLLPGLPHGPEQREGYFYLGAGMLCIVGLALVMLGVPSQRRRLRQLPWRRARWPLLSALACAVFALASPIRWGEDEVLRIESYKRIASITDTFRSSGRFIWPLGYSISIAATLALVHVLRRRRWLVSSVLLAAIGLQAYDLTLDVALKRFKHPRTHAYNHPAWELATNDFKHLVLYPAQVKRVCNPYLHFVSELAYLAYRHNWTFNSGYAARYPSVQPRACAELKAQLQKRKLRDDSIYVGVKRDLREFRDHGATCASLDAVFVCVKSGTGAFASYLATHPK